MTHNNKIYDLLYFKGIIKDYNIKLESIKNEKVDDENLKIVVSVIKLIVFLKIFDIIIYEMEVLI